MKCFIDGNKLCVIKDDFINLQESEAVFFNLDSKIAKTIISDGFTMLLVSDLRQLAIDLKMI